MGLMSASRADPDRTIVVTGMGIIAACGDSPSAVWESLVRGRSPAKWYTGAGSREDSPIAVCEVPALAPRPTSRERSTKLGRCARLALDAASQAFTMAGLKADGVDGDHLSVIAGTSRGPSQKWAEGFNLVQKGTRRLPPSLGAHCSITSLSGVLALAFQAQGPCMTVSAACASAAHAIALGAQQLLLGTADRVLAGGAEASIDDLILRQLHALGVLGTHADPRLTCRPFDAGRDGTLVGEGAAFLVLETLTSARQRGAAIQAVLSGWALGSDPTNATSPAQNGEGLYRVMKQSLLMAGLDPIAINHVNTHGTATVMNDRAEAIAIHRLFADRTETLPCSATKPVTGHCLGASAAVEAVISILSLHHQRIPATLACAQIDPVCSLDLVRDHPQDLRLNHVMSNSVGFWGNNASLIFSLAD